MKTPTRTELANTLAQRSTPELVCALEWLDAQGRLNPQQQSEQTVTEEILCARHSEIAAAHEQWKANPRSMLRGSEVIVSASRRLGTQYVWCENDRMIVGSLGQYAQAWERMVSTPSALTLSTVVKTWEGDTFKVRIEPMDESVRFTAGNNVYECRQLRRPSSSRSSPR